MPGSAKGAFIVDTGLPEGLGHTEIGDLFYVAGKIALPEDQTIYSIESVFVDTLYNNPLAINVYEDTGALPISYGIGYSPVFTQVFSPIVTTPDVPVWSGIYDINLSLSAGMYWVALEPRLGGFVYGGGVGSGSPNPLQAYATNDPTRGNQYLETIDTNDYFALRVSNSPIQTVVPEPTTVALIGLGLAWTGFFRRRN